MKREFLRTENYIRMYDLMSTLLDLEDNPERMGLAYGQFGLGKTFSLEKLTTEFDCILLRTDQTWTVSSVLKILATEMGIDAKGKSSELMERIVSALLFSPRPIIIDEVDTLLPAPKFSVLELFRDIHDETGNALLMVGMESCDARLKNHPHFYSRIVGKTKFKDIPLEDIERFCALCGTESNGEFNPITIKPDLVKYFAQRYKNLRIIKVLLLRIERWCEMNGISSVDLKSFQQSGVEHAEK